MNLATFSKQYPALVVQLTALGFTLDEISFKGDLDMTAVGVWTLGTSPWDDEAFALAISKEPTLKLSNLMKPMTLQPAEGSKKFLGSFRHGELLSSEHIAESTTPIVEPLIGRSHAAGLSEKIRVLLRQPTTVKVSPTGFNLKVDQSATQFYSVPEDIAWNLFTVEDRELLGWKTRFTRNVNKVTQPGKVFIAVTQSPGSQQWTVKSGFEMWQGNNYSTSEYQAFAPTGTIWADLGNCIAPDADFTGLFTMLSEGSSVGWTEIVKKASPLGGGAFTVHDGYSGKSAALMIEVPPVNRYTDDWIVMAPDGLTVDYKAPSRRRVYWTPVTTAVKMMSVYSSSHAIKIYGGDLKVGFEGGERLFSAFPTTAVGNQLMSEKGLFYPLTGVVPAIDYGMLGEWDADAKVLTADSCFYRVSRNWYSDYLTGKFGQVQKRVAADRLAATWRPELPEYYGLVYNFIGKQFTIEDVKSLHAYRQYGKARSKACKSNNFLDLEAGAGKSYMDIVQYWQSNGATHYIGSFTDQILRESKRSSHVPAQITITVAGQVWTVKVGSDTDVFDLAAITPERKELLQVHAVNAYITGRVLPASWQTTLDVSEGLLTSAKQEIFDNFYGEKTSVEVVDHSSNRSGTTGVVHTNAALHVNGFVNINFVAREFATQAAIANTASLRLMNTSLISIFKQFVGG